MFGSELTRVNQGINKNTYLFKRERNESKIPSNPVFVTFRFYRASNAENTGTSYLSFWKGGYISASSMYIVGHTLLKHTTTVSVMQSLCLIKRNVRKKSNSICGFRLALSHPEFLMIFIFTQRYTAYGRFNTNRNM